MKKTGRRLFFVILSLCVLLCGCSANTGGKEFASSQNEQKADSAAVSEEESVGSSDSVVFEGQNVEGEPVTSEVFGQSRLTMVNVWATYCNPCLSEMPSLGELAGEYEAEDFQIIGIISDVIEDRDPELASYAADLIEQTGAAYPHLVLNESIYYALLEDVSAVPTTYFVNADGVVIDTVVGARKKAEWKEKIDALLEDC